MRSTSSSISRFVHEAYNELRSAAHSMTALNTTLPAEINNYLLPTERHAFSVRQHPAILIGPSALALAGLVAAIVLTNIVLPGNGDFVLAVWIAWCILFLRVIGKTISWARAFFVVSSVRLLLVTGTLSRKVGVIPIASVTDMAVQSSFSGRVLGYGNLIVEYGGLDQKAQRIEYIPYAEEFYRIVSEAIFPDLKMDSPAERAPCPVCNGDGKIFRRASKSAKVDGQTSDDRPADDLIRTREDLLAQGYVEAVCPTCDGEGTVRAESL